MQFNVNAQDLLKPFFVSTGSGRSFGELALINKDSSRNASIVVNTTTDLLVIHRALFDRSLRADQTDHYEARKKFVNVGLLINCRAV